MAEYRWIEDVKEFQGLSSEWDKALFLSGEDNPFLLSDFLLTWWKHYSHSMKKIMIFVVFKNGKLTGGIPLCQDMQYNLEYPGGWTANYTEPLCIESDKTPVWDAFLGALPEKKDWRCVILKRILENKLDISFLNYASRSRFSRIFPEVSRDNRSYLIDIPQDFSGYFSRLPKTLRYYIRRSENEFAKLGKISLYLVKNCDEIDKLTDVFIKLSKESFNKRDKKSIFEDTRYCSFFRELLNKFCRAGFLDANVLKLDDRIIAIHFGYSIGNNLNYIFPTFDADFARLNPGHLLIYKLVELGVARKNKIMDLYTGYQFYKEQWSGRKEKIISLQIWPDSLMGRVSRLVNICKNAGRKTKDLITER